MRYDVVVYSNHKFIAKSKFIPKITLMYIFTMFDAGESSFDHKAN